MDENMRRAHKRNAVHGERFFFRKFIAPFQEELLQEVLQRGTEGGSGSEGAGVPAGVSDSARKAANPCGGCDFWDIQDSYEEMTTREIFLGKECYYPGLIPLVYAYLDFIKCSKETFSKIDEYLQYIVRYARQCGVCVSAGMAVYHVCYWV